MERIQYDQYVPEKGLDTNFRITRKRTADESFGNYNYQQQSMLYDTNSTSLHAYGYNNKPNNLPPRPAVSQGASFGFNQSSNLNNMRLIEYPKRMMMSNKFNNELDLKRDGPLWLGDPSNSSYFHKNDTEPYDRFRESETIWTRRDHFKGIQGQSGASLDMNNSTGVINNQERNSWFGRNFNTGGFNKNNSGPGAGSQNQREFGNMGKNNFGSSWNKNDKPWKGLGNKSNEGHSKFNRNWKKPEKPKTSARPLAIPDKTDESLPAELREMFEPLFCKLCSMQFTSNVMAKMHYVSKNHEKKIRKYLIDHAEKTGEPLHPRASVTATEKKEKEVDKDPKNFYCELCDLKLTGKQHADSHYMGKSHNAVRMGKKKPGGKGYFDQNGKWIRFSKEQTPLLAEGEDNFGMEFKKKPEEVDAKNTDNVDPPGKTTTQFTCSLCLVSCVSQEQLEIHLSGSKHKKKMKLKGLNPENFILPKDTNQEEDNIEMTKVSENTIDSSLKSKYITPNGNYYCEKCNLNVNSETQFKQHLASKNHAKKANEKKTQ